MRFSSTFSPGVFLSSSEGAVTTTGVLVVQLALIACMNYVQVVIINYNVLCKSTNGDTNINTPVSCF